MNNDWTRGLERASNRQVGGSHYKKCHIQPAHYAEVNGLSFLEGSVVKRVTRWKDVEDLYKAIHELELLIEEQHTPPQDGGDESPSGPTKWTDSSPSQRSNYPPEPEGFD